MTAPELAVVHLVWAPAGLAPFRAFVDSYRRCAAGEEHDLVLLYNGFDRDSLSAHRELAAGLGAGEIVLDERCLDLEAYARAAARLQHRTLCILNSYSVLLYPGWLRKLHAPLALPGVGAASATGSWGSPLGYGLWQAGLRSDYGRALGRRRRTAALWHEVNGIPYRGPARLAVDNLADVALNARHGARFPAVHLRTNAFVIGRERYLEIAGRRLDSKRATYHLESGRHGMTAQLRRQGLETLVVDRDGATHRPELWPEADVFWQAGQEALLVSDNQTRLYDGATAEQREVLRRFAWGSRARNR